MMVIIIGYGVACTVFGIVFGYVVGPSIAHWYRKLTRGLRGRQ